jgi:signal transduction histidine kinase
VSTTKDLRLADVFDAAMRMLIIDRCRQAYVHEMRGGLQAVYSSIELLVRSARQGAANAALTENASAMAKRAIANHERALLEIFDQVAAPINTPVAVNMAGVVRDALRFLRNDATSKDIRIDVHAGEELWVTASVNRLRTFFLGLLALSIDTLPAGAELQIEVRSSGDDGCIELRSEVSLGDGRTAADLSRDAGRCVAPDELVYGCAHHWLQKDGGRFEVDSVAGSNRALRIYVPLRAV